jgi:hypothetical protein
MLFLFFILNSLSGVQDHIPFKKVRDDCFFINYAVALVKQLNSNCLFSASVGQNCRYAD